MSDVLPGGKQEEYKRHLEEQYKERMALAEENERKLKEKKKARADQMQESKNLGAVAMGRGSTIMSDKLG